MKETAHLKWTNINKNLNNTFKRLKGNSDFSDVTLVCEDGQKTVVHKAMLAASSPLFHGLLNSERNDHQMIFLAGVKSEYVSSVVDFIYCGQTMVQKANVDSFIAIANDLKLEAIFGKTKSNFDDDPIPMISQVCPRIVFRTASRKISDLLEESHPYNQVKFIMIIILLMILVLMIYAK